MLKLRLLTGPRAGRQLRVSDTKPVSIGRRKGRLRLHDSRVSKDHAEIYFANDVWILKDLGSANGTYVNRKKVTGLIELEPGDLIQMGRVLIKIVRCDMIGMDTQPFEPSAVEGIELGGGIAAPTSPDDDFDLDDLLSDTDAADANDDSFGDVPAGLSAPAIEEEKPDVGAEESIEQDEDVPEPLTVAFDEPVDDDDSFFSDVGEATDTTDGKDLGVHDDVPEDTDVPVEPAIEIEEPLKLDASDSSAAEIEIQAREEAEPDPFLPDGPEEETDDDLISLDDESGIGHRSHGTTLLTTAHDDGTPLDEAEQSDEMLLDDAEDEHEEDDEPPALVGLALEHAPPQQPQQPVDEESPEQESQEDVVSAELADQDEESEDAEPELQQLSEEVPASVEEPLVLDETPEATEEQPELEAVEEAPAEAPHVAEVQPEPEPEPELEPEPDLDEPDEVEMPVAAAPDDVVDAVELDDEAGDFDIDAAFDDLSAGLDDSLSGMPAVEGITGDTAGIESVLTQDQSAERASAEGVDPLVGSQLDVSFIKDALSRIEDDSTNGEELKDEGAASETTADAVVEPTPESAETDPVVQSPPPGLSAADMNPTTVNAPEEPRRTHTTKGKGGIGQWFFMLVFLCLAGVGGWLLNENYDKLIGSRGIIAPPQGDTPPVNDTPRPPSDPQIEPEGQTSPVVPPVVANPIDETPPVVRVGPDPFGAGPSVIGSDALAGLTRGSDDDRPLDPPRQATTGVDSVPDKIRNPVTPTINPTEPTKPLVVEPDDRPGPIDPGPTVPEVVSEKPARIVFLVDASGSLVDSLPQMLVWLNRALQTVESNEQFAIYFFKSGKPIAIKPEGMLKPSRNLLNQIAEEYLNASRMPVFPSGRSNPAEAITQALALEPTDLYLLSDDAFAFYQGDTSSGEALDLVKQAVGDTEVRIHGVQFFYKSEDSILETLAEEYDGTFEYVRESVVPDEDPIDLLKELDNE